jgi:potassium voltage-gated channel Eag-related subfamily H protein 7
VQNNHCLAHLHCFTDEIAFSGIHPTPNMIVDVIFGIDIVLHFFLMVRHASASKRFVIFLILLSFSQYRDNNGTWVSSPRRICTHYLSGWFWLDVVSVFPFREFVIPEKEGFALLPRMIRVLKLLRLLKIIQVSDTTSHWRARITIGADVQTMAVLLVAIFTSAHWMACLWGSLATFADKTQPTWATGWVSGQVEAGTARGGSECIGAYIDPQEHGDALAGTADTATAEMLGALSNGAMWQGCVQPHDLYMVSLYWAIMTLTSIGYGDVIPSNNTEYSVSVGTCSTREHTHTHTHTYTQMLNAL